MSGTGTTTAHTPGLIASPSLAFARGFISFGKD